MVINLAKIIGGSGSTDCLKSQLRKVKLDGLDTYQGIKSFKDKFPQLIQEKQGEEKAKLYQEIDVLKDNAKILSLKLQKSIELHKNELQAKKEKLSHVLESKDSSRSAKRQLKKIETKFGKMVEKPFKKDKKDIKKTKKSYLSIEKKFDKTIEKKIAPYHKADEKIDKNISFLFGAKGEELIIKELSNFPDTYYVFNEYKFKLPKICLFKKHS